jgi:excisionase family DNA binding protein
VPKKDFMQDYFTIDETAEALGVSVITVNRMLAKGTLARVKAGWATLIDRKTVERVKQERQPED